jgi:hypothetical protein
VAGRGDRWVPAAVLLAGALLAGAAAELAVAPAARRESRELVEAAVRRSAVQCYAIEGAYPRSLQELRDRYGLSVDETRWMVDYRYMADNLSPDITVLPRS